jgi:hypothetical protein
MILNALENVMRNIHSSFVVQSVSCDSVDLWSKILNICTDLLSCLKCILNFDTRKPEFEVEAEAEMHFEGSPVESPTSKEDELSGAPIVLKPVILIFIQIAVISV